MDIAKETLIEHIENLFDNIEAGEPAETVVELTALGAEVKLDLSSLAYGAIILLNGTLWLKEDETIWTENGMGRLSNLELAQSIRTVGPRDAVFLYNGEVYR